MSTSIEQAKAAIIDNLHQIFEEPDKAKRDEQIKRIWCESSEATFVDPEKIWYGHKEISSCVDDLQIKFKDWVFKELGPVLVLPEGGNETLRIARVKWSYGPPGEDPKVYGEDIAKLVDGKITMLAAIIEPQSLAN